MLGPPDVAVFARPTAVRSHPLVPEVPLHLLADDLDLGREYAAVVAADRVPFWPFVWAGGALLARRILDEPALVRDRVVVDFGAGSGIVGIAAALAGAARVVCVDVDPDALAACRANAALSSVQLDTSERVPSAWDTLAVADVLYLVDNTDVLVALACSGRSALLCEGARPGAPTVRARAVLDRNVATFPDVDVGDVRVRLYEFPDAGALADALER